jgi:hypothetical protein
MRNFIRLNIETDLGVSAGFWVLRDPCTFQFPVNQGDPIVVTGNLSLFSDFAQASRRGQRFFDNFEFEVELTGNQPVNPRLLERTILNLVRAKYRGDNSARGRFVENIDFASATTEDIPE